MHSCTNICAKLLTLAWAFCGNLCMLWVVLVLCAIGAIDLVLGQPLKRCLFFNHKTFTLKWVLLSQRNCHLCIPLTRILQHCINCFMYSSYFWCVENRIKSDQILCVLVAFKLRPLLCISKICLSSFLPRKIWSYFSTLLCLQSVASDLIRLFSCLQLVSYLVFAWPVACVLALVSVRNFPGGLHHLCTVLPSPSCADCTVLFFHFYVTHSHRYNQTVFMEGLPHVVWMMYGIVVCFCFFHGDKD